MHKSFNTALKKVSSGYSLSTEVGLRFSFILFVSVLGSALLAGILERNGVLKSVKMIEETVMESELDSMFVRVDQFRLTASSLFRQAKLDAVMVAEYAFDNMNGTAGNTRFSSGDNDYVNYAMAGKSYAQFRNSVPPGSYTGSFAYNGITGSNAFTNDYYSGWFNKHAYSFSTKQLTASGTEYLMASRTMDNVLVPLLAGNPNYGEAYIGFENSLYRKVPFYDVSSYHADRESECLDTSDTQGYPCMYYECQKTPKQYQHGYEPVCRTWYILAKADQSQAVFSPPYIGASKGLAMITVAKAVRVNTTNTMIGVVGIDLYISDLKTSVLSAKILKSGYSYLIDKDLNVIMHPDSSSTDVQRVCEVEFDSCTSSEALAYNDKLNTVITKQQRGQWRFDKGDANYWWITYGPVNDTDYLMIMTVPEAEVEEIAEQVREEGQLALSLVIGLSIGLGIIMLFVGGRAARYVAGKIAGPVQDFNSIMTDINNDHMEAINLDLAVAEFKQINKLQSRILSLYLAVKFSTNAYYKDDFEEALKYLEQVEDMFQHMKQKAAVGVVSNNKGEILRQHANKIKGNAEVHRGDRYYENYVPALRAIDLALGNINGQIIINENKIKDLNRRKASQARIEDASLLDTERSLRNRAMKLTSTLASRQNNKALCLKDAGDLEEAVQMTQDAFRNYERCDNLIGMIKVLGNKGLIYLDMNAASEAENCFRQAYNMAHAKFSDNPSEDSCTAFQYACMNIGLHRVYVLDHMEQSEKVKHEALQHFYYAITVSNRVDKQVLRICVKNIYEIFDKYYKHDDIGGIAKYKLTQMFPIIPSKAKVAFLVDVSPSMNGYERIIKAVDVMRDIVSNKMSAGDYFSMDIFAKNHDILVDPCILDSNNKSVILDTIFTLQYRCTSGATFFYKSLLEMGQTIMKMHGNSKDRTKAANFAVLALTDGEDNEYSTSPNSVKDFYNQCGIKLIVVTIAASDRMKKNLINTLMESPDLLLTAEDDPTSLFDAMQKGFDMASQGAATMEAL